MKNARIGDKVKVNKTLWRYSNPIRKYNKPITDDDDITVIYSEYQKLKSKFKSEWKIYAEEGEEGIITEVFRDKQYIKSYHIKVDVNGFTKNFKQSSVDLVERIVIKPRKK